MITWFAKYGFNLKSVLFQEKSHMMGFSNVLEISILILIGT